MSEMYSNEIGKSRLADKDCLKQSSLRKEWFSMFEKKMKRSFPDLMKNVELRIVGSVAKDLASVDSDIDIIVKTKSSDKLLISQIRHAIFELLDEMKESGDKVYNIDIQELGNPLMFSAMAMFRKQQK